MPEATTHHGFTIADLEAMPEDGRRYELIGGSIIVSPSPTPRHQRASFRLQRLLDDALAPRHTVFNAPIDLDLPWEQRVVPDLVVVPDSSILAKRLDLPVLLIVELVSPSSTLYDRNVKRDVYAQAGIEHYWIVDTRPDQQRFTAHRLQGQEYEVVADDDERIEIAEPVAVSVALTDLLD